MAASALVRRRDRITAGRLAAPAKTGRSGDGERHMGSTPRRGEGNQTGAGCGDEMQRQSKGTPASTIKSLKRRRMDWVGAANRTPGTAAGQRTIGSPAMENKVWASGI